MSGYDSGITYVIAYCAEDVNGVVGPVKFAQVTTTATVAGPNPIVTIENLQYNAQTGEVSGRFVANDNTKMIKYFTVSSSDVLYGNCALHDLVNTSRRDYNTYLTLWESQLIQMGLSSNADSVPFSSRVSASSDTPVLFAAVGIGEDDGVDVYSPVAAKIWYKGEFKELSDFRTPGE